MDALQRLKDADAVRRLTERDPLLFSSDVDMRQPIMQRLGWTDLATAATGRLPLVTNLAKALLAEGATDVVLLGMGGSSLAALTLNRVIGPAPGMPRLHVLDSTSPIAVAALLESLDRTRTFFLLASKSGTTVEPLSLYAIFRAWMETELERPTAGKHFIAITDPGTPLEKLRQREVMRVALSAPATVGGRFSALSMFGLAPAALSGMDLEALVSSAQDMEEACRLPADENPAGQLAAFIVDAYEEGRDKLTLACSSAYESFALWIEQLVAESTGKNETGVVPVIDYAPALPLTYGSDRAVVVIRGHDDHELASWATQVSAVHPLLEMVLDNPLGIGGLFVQWEYAVALAGHLLGINPFDEPNVAEAKETTMRVLQGAATVPPASADIGGTWVTYAGGLDGSAAPTTLDEAVRPFVSSMGDRDYGAVLAYVPDEERFVRPLRTAVTRLAAATGRPIALEIGPRYLHSTGQLHKGGPDTGVFLVLTARDKVDLAIPERDYTLGQLFRAQAEGDLTTLAAHGRRVMRLDIAETTPDSIAAVADVLGGATR